MVIEILVKLQAFTNPRLHQGSLHACIYIELLINTHLNYHDQNFIMEKLP